MFKRITLLARRPDQSAHAFQTHWSRVHARLVLQLPGIRRYVQNDVVAATPGVRYDGIVELWFDEARDLQAAFDSDAGRALPLDEANFLAGKIVSDVQEHVLVAGAPGDAPAKLMSLVLGDPTDEAGWHRRHEYLRGARHTIAGLVSMSHHRVVSQRHVGGEPSGARAVADFLVYHFESGGAREAFLQGPCDAVERPPQDATATLVRLAVTERILEDAGPALDRRAPAQR